MPAPHDAEHTPVLPAQDRAARRRLGRAALAAMLGLGAAWAAALRDGFHQPLAPGALLVALQVVQMAALALALSSLDADGRARTWREVGAAWLEALRPPAARRERLPAAPPTGLDVFILGALPALAAIAAAIGLRRLGIVFLDGAAVLGALLAMARLGVQLLRWLNAPGLLLPATFVLLIASGTALLMLPRCAGNEPVRWVDALFTATSATCVTGLVVRSTAVGFSEGGQGVIALLIQLGGLGIVVFGATFAALLRGTLSLREHVTVRDLLERQSLADLRRFALIVVGLTLLFEVIGAAVMLPLWQAPAGGGAELAPGRRVWLSVFHSVSAFCNAGFDITGQSMEPYRRSMLVHAVIAPLVILGGIGFPVIQDCWRWARERIGARRRRGPGQGSPARKKRSHMALHSRVTIITTVALLLGGTLAIGLAQVDRATGDGAGVGGRIADAWFMSLTARTAGFNTVPMDELTPASTMTLIALMCVGGSPGSMAGGLKTTTLAVLALAALATIRGRDETEVLGRSIPEMLVRKAGAIAICMLALIATSTVLLCLTEQREPFAMLFEAVSAATTTGLSLGVTQGLSDPGKLVLVATMFLGRVGPLTLLGVLMVRRPPARGYLYPRESVTLG